MQAYVQPNFIKVDQNKIAPNVIEDGDTIEAFYSNGTTVTYRVVEANYYEDFHSLPAHYQLKTAKANKRTGKSGSLPLRAIHNTGSGNVVITNNSSHTNVQITQDLSKFEEIKNAIEDSEEIANKEVVLQLLEELKHSANNKETFISKYNNFVTALAGHVTVLTPFLPYLASFFHT